MVMAVPTMPADWWDMIQPMHHAKALGKPAGLVFAAIAAATTRSYTDGAPIV